MKRLHVHVAVDDIDASTEFYARLFDAEPVLRRRDYARWMLEDPSVNFAISLRGKKKGISHVGIQAENNDELDGLFERLDAIDGPQRDEGLTTCCYANSTKRWISDPQGVAWETFLTHGNTQEFGQTPDTTARDVPEAERRCCG